MEKILCKAIQERTIVQFSYYGQRQTVEPYVLGRLKNSSAIVLSAYRVGAIAETGSAWELFDLDKITDLVLIDLKAGAFRLGGQRNMNKMGFLICKC